jgi:hypothetical protein
VAADTGVGRNSRFDWATLRQREDRNQPREPSYVVNQAIERVEADLHKRYFSLSSVSILGPSPEAEA